MNPPEIKLRHNQSKFFVVSKWRVANEVSLFLRELLEVSGDRDFTENELEIADRIITMYDTYVHHIGPAMNQLKYLLTLQDGALE